jgi:D-alanyl-D-alanine carboxypeptidase
MLWDNPRRMDGHSGRRRGHQVAIMAAKTMLNEEYRQLHEELGIPPDYGQDGSPPYYAEASELVDIGPNLVGRMQRLTPEAAARWQEMTEAASGDGIRLLIVSGFRDFAYQAGLIRRKLEAGEEIGKILTVNAAPGFSQHHTGCAIDIATPGSRPLTEEFEESDAFRWLGTNAAGFGFSMTYPRDNPCGFIFEPWHWALNEWIGAQTG